MVTYYEIIVIGGGHAGCEAALAAARLGCKTLLLTMSADTIGFMSCNPAIGGVAKGQLVKEIDALGGQMAKAADEAAIQMRLLNTRKGPAVRSTRAQVDRQRYRLYMKAVLEGRPSLDIKEGMVEELLVKNGSVQGVRTSLKESYFATSIIVTPGTFLNGLIHIGLEHHPGGRIGERRSEGLSTSLKALGFKMGRLKTGTCARLDGRTIDFERLKAQHGDCDIAPFSFQTKRLPKEQLPCYITYTNEKTHDIIRKSLDRSPLFTGVIKGTGVRYCPSIEDKVFRFPERDRHHIFLEPEGLNTVEYYPNGISTSLPIDVQEEIVNSIEGLEDAKIMRPGYGIEYDFVDPTQLLPTLETKAVKGLYLAGQINGTTGYEEAACLGLMAGINAALKAKGRSPLILERSESYIGVLVDDLVTKGTNEPYRMFTSRVEYRLLLREDNADLRLVPVGFKIGLVDKSRYEDIQKKKENIAREIARLNGSGLAKVLRRPGISYEDIRSSEDGAPLSRPEIEEVEIEIKYEGFIRRQLNDISRLGKIERIRIPEDIDYTSIHGLSTEIKEKLSRIMPVNLGQASRISGVTPAAISILMIYLEKLRREDNPLKRYNDYNSYLRKRYGAKVYRIALDAGFSCPNRIGDDPASGCIYCNGRGSRAGYIEPSEPPGEQLKKRMDYLRREKKAEKFVAYFQAFTNTYGDIGTLKKAYDSVLPFKDIVGISIGTRPDAIDDEKLKLISSYKDYYEVWLEYGLQSVHDRTLKLINRGHDFDAFLKAVRLTKEYGIKVCSHIILGLPGESPEDMLETARRLSALKIDGIKIHLLHVLKGSALEGLYRKGEVRLLERDEYVKVVCDFLEELSPDIIIQRLTGEGDREDHLAPLWALDKTGVLWDIDRELERRGTRQGARSSSRQLSRHS